MPAAIVTRPMAGYARCHRENRTQAEELLALSANSMPGLVRSETQGECEGHRGGAQAEGHRPRRGGGGHVDVDAAHQRGIIVMNTRAGKKNTISRPSTPSSLMVSTARNIRRPIAA